MVLKPSGKWEMILKNLDTCCKGMAKYISIYFDIPHQKLVGSGWLQATSETKIVSWIRLGWEQATEGISSSPPNDKLLEQQRSDFIGPEYDHCLVTPFLTH